MEQDMELLKSRGLLLVDMVQLAGAAFLDSALNQELNSLVPGKRVLDIGCGAGNWCVTAAQCGAKSVDGFDIQPELAKPTFGHGPHTSWRYCRYMF